MLFCWCANSVKWCTLVKKISQHASYHISCSKSSQNPFLLKAQCQAALLRLDKAERKPTTSTRHKAKAAAQFARPFASKWGATKTSVIGAVGIFQPLAVVAKSDCKICKLRPEIQKWKEFSGEVRIPNVQCSHPQVHGTTKSVLSRDRMLCEPQSTKVNGNAMANSPAKKEGMSRREGCAEWARPLSHIGCSITVYNWSWNVDMLLTCAVRQSPAMECRDRKLQHVWRIDLMPKWYLTQPSNLAIKSGMVTLAWQMCPKRDQLENLWGFGVLLDSFGTLPYTFSKFYILDMTRSKHNNHATRKSVSPELRLRFFSDSCAEHLDFAWLLYERPGDPKFPAPFSKDPTFASAQATMSTSRALSIGTRFSTCQCTQMPDSHACTLFLI